MSETRDDQAPAQTAQAPRRKRGGCLIPLLVVAGVAVALFFIIGFIFDDPNAEQPLHGLDAGAESSLQPGTINQFDGLDLGIALCQSASLVADQDRAWLG